MRHAFSLMLVISVVIGLGAALLAGGLVGLIQWWIAVSHYQVILDPNTQTLREYRTTGEQSYNVWSGIGAFFLVAGVAFVRLLRTIPERRAEEKT